jgi:uncharacterized protein
MIVGTLLAALRLPGSETLKDKRRVVRSLLEKSRRRFGVSAAEVDDLGLSGNATLGFAFVSSSRAQTEKTLAAVLEWIESHPEVEVYDLEREIEARSEG